MQRSEEDADISERKGFVYCGQRRFLESLITFSVEIEGKKIIYKVKTWTIFIFKNVKICFTK